MDWLWKAIDPVEWIKSPFVRDWLGSNIRHWLVLLFVTKLGWSAMGEHIDVFSLGLTNFLIAAGGIGFTALYSAWRSSHDRAAPPPPGNPTQLPGSFAPPLWLLLLVGYATFSLPFIPGCVSPKTAEPLAQHNQVAVQNLAETYGRDLALLRMSIVDRVKLGMVHELGDAHRSLVAAGYVLGGEASPDKLDADLADPEKSNALLDEVRLGRMSVDGAKAWLSDYAALQRASNSKPLTDAMLAQLAGPSAWAAQANAALEAFDKHAAAVVENIADVRGNADALVEFAGAKYVLQEFLEAEGKQAWSWAVTSNLKDPAKKEESEQLFSDLIGLPRVSN